jgi:predicted GIY-YIG superfamily endonuclease
MADCFVYVLSDYSGIRYVGVSVNPDKRVRFHVYEATNEKNKSYHLRKSRWLRSIGFDFLHRVIFSGTEEDCYLKEIEIIDKLKSKGKNLVNTSKGGDKPPRINELPNFEQTRNKISQKAIGRKISEETRKKMSDSHRANGKPNWLGDVSGYKNPRSRAVVQMDTDGNVLFIWATAKEACDALGLRRSAVTSVVKGYQSTCGGFKFDYF